MQFVSSVYSCLEHKLFSVGVFLDMSKAFDSLNHKILLAKLKNIGVRGVPLELFASYLSNRSQFVYCNNSSSSFQTIVKGVPQGSILGPIMFLIYINDIVHASSKFSFVIYADDTILLISDKSLNTLHLNLNSELQHISQWMKSNKLTLNVTKTNYIYFKTVH